MTDPAGENTQNNLTDILDTLSEKAKSHNTQIQDILKALRGRGFGPLLLAPALLIILPTGAIPGVPALCGAFIFLISIQIFMGLQHPWLPEKMRVYTLDRNRIRRGIQKIRPYAVKIDKHMHGRLRFLTDNRIAVRIVAMTSMGLALFIIVIGFIPFVPALLALPIVFFALGLSMRDGLILAAGYAALSAAALILYYYQIKA